MEKATSRIRRSGAFLLSFGTGYQELNLIISDIKILKSQIKAIKDSQRTIVEDLLNWSSCEENKSFQELFIYLADLNSLWCEAQNSFATQVAGFRRIVEMILDGERNTDASRNKFANCEVLEEKAKKKVKKAEKKQNAEDIRAAEKKLSECARERELAYVEATENAKENEALKLMHIKNGLLKLTEAYLALSTKCMYIFEAQKEIVEKLPDVGDGDIHEIRFNDMSSAKDIVRRVESLIKHNRDTNQPAAPTSPGDQIPDPPPPYSPSPSFVSSPYNPYYVSPGDEPGVSAPGNEGTSRLYPTVSRTEEDLANSMNAIKLSPGT